MFGIIFLARDPKYTKSRVRSFRLYFRSLSERKCFDVNFPRRYYYPQDILIDNLKRKRGQIKRYQFTSDPFLHELFSASNYIIEFTQDYKFNKYKFWDELEDWCSRVGYKIFSLSDRVHSCFVEIKTITEFYGEI